MLRRSMLMGTTILRAPEGVGGGGGDMGGGNGGDQGNFSGEQSQDGSQNNTVQADPFDTFWNEPEAAGQESSPDRSSPTPPNPDASGLQTNSSGNPVDQLNQHLKAVQFSNVLTEDVLTKMNDGDYEGFNTSLQNMGRDVMRETLVRSAQMMNQVQSQMKATVEKMVRDQLDSRSATDTLNNGLPFANDPMMKPVAQGVYAQALKKSGGDKNKALTMTRDYFKRTMQLQAGDLGLDVAPTNRDSASNHNRRAAEVNWVDELGLGRS